MAEYIKPTLESEETMTLSPLRNRNKNPNQTPTDMISIIKENDDAAELSSRRKSMMDRRKSIGLGKVAQMPEHQLEERMKLCIQLSTENKINIKNAFNFEIIDILTCMVKRNSTISTLQVASSSLDVSSKIYGLRVDKVHTDVLQMLGSIDKQEQQANEENTENGDGIENNTIKQEQKKKKGKKKRGSVITKAESLKGNVELTSPNSLMSQDGDPQTSDMLYQTVLPLTTQNLYYMMNSIRALDEICPRDLNKIVKFQDIMPKVDSIENYEICRAFKDFYFHNFTINKNNDESDEDLIIEPSQNQHERSIFQFDLDASLPLNGTQLNDDFDKENVVNPGTYLSKNISAGVKVRTLEYSYIPTNEIIHWVGPSYWKVKVKNSTNEKTVESAANIKTKKKVINLEFNDETIEEVSKYLKISKSTQLSLKTMKSWTEDKLMIPDDMTKKYDVTKLYRFGLRPENNIKIVQQNEVNTTHLNNDNDEVIYDYNNALDISEYCPDVDSDNDDAQNEIERDEVIGKLSGDNLVEMPDLVTDTYIPYSKRAKKLDVRQLKKSIWKTITKNVQDKDKEKNKSKCNKLDKLDAKRSFSEIYEELPKLLTKGNLEALSVPVCFVSLLHLANEKTLFIKPNEDLSNLDVLTDCQVSH